MSVTEDGISGYRFGAAGLYPSSIRCLPIIKRHIISADTAIDTIKVFDLGCGNGALANEVAKFGCIVEGVDPSLEGIELAKKNYPHLNLSSGSGYEALHLRYGTYDLVYSIEVIEHVYDPHLFASNLFSLVRPGGVALVSTPYHGYVKNLALAITGKLDGHFTALWKHGHIKFWSISTLTKLLASVGFESFAVYRLGRIPIFANSMLIVARRPLQIGVR